jgi:hypothetical protein
LHCHSDNQGLQKKKSRARKNQARNEQTSSAPAREREVLFIASSLLSSFSLAIHATVHM